MTAKYDAYISTRKEPQAGMDSSFDAWEEYKKAEKAYYATDEGLSVLDEHLSQGKISNENYARAKREALDFRFNEELSSGKNSWGRKQAAQVAPFPVKLYSTTPVNGVHLISDMKGPSGEYVNKYLWDEKNQYLYIEVEDLNCEADVEGMTMIGKANSKDQALYQAFEWYRKRG